MSKRRRSIGLIAFLKGNTDVAVGMPGCANYDHYYDECLFADECLVQQGKRCGYFERAVLPTAEDMGLTEQVYSLYEKHVGIDGGLNREPVRRCPDCGAEIKPRKRYCDDCVRKRRRKTFCRSRSKRNS